jgi:two-component system, cell cycle sensor histidine kinase and response regulator CckA
VTSTAKTILLVDDEPRVLDLLRAVLTGNGYRVLIASSGQVAISLFEEEGRKVDLLITDVVMPGMLGTELANRLVVMQPDLPVLYTSGVVDSHLLERFIECRFRSYALEKPFEMGALLRMVQEAVGEPKPLAVGSGA